MKLSADTRGLEEHLERIVKMGKEIDPAIDRALEPAGKMLQKSMQSLAPELTGNLKANIKMDGPRTDGNLHTMEVGVIHKSGMTDADTARYANAQEYGTSSMAAHPFNRPTAETKGKLARKMIKESLKAEGLL